MRACLSNQYFTWRWRTSNSQKIIIQFYVPPKFHNKVLTDFKLTHLPWNAREGKNAQNHDWNNSIRFIVRTSGQYKTMLFAVVTRKIKLTQGKIHRTKMKTRLLGEKKKVTQVYTTCLTHICRIFVFCPTNAVTINYHIGNFSTCTIKKKKTTRKKCKHRTSKMMGGWGWGKMRARRMQGTGTTSAQSIIWKTSCFSTTIRIWHNCNTIFTYPSLNV